MTQSRKTLYINIPRFIAILEGHVPQPAMSLGYMEGPVILMGNSFNGMGVHVEHTEQIDIRQTWASAA